MIPTNGHVLIEPVVHEAFMASSRETYDEIGVVVAIDPNTPTPYEVGDRVFFDSWLASKYPKNDTENYWLVKHEDVRAYEKQIPE